MTRLAIIGDSHLAALKLGWDTLAESHNDVQITFFGAAGAGLSGARLEGGCLVAGTPELRRGFALTSGGLDHIPLGQFDMLVLTGLRLSLVSLVRTVYSRYRSDAHNNLDGEVSLVSEAAFLEICRRKLSESIGYRLARDLSAVSAIPILMVPQPLPSDMLLETEEMELDAPLWRALFQAGDDAAMEAVMVSVIESLSTDRIQFMSPPEATRSGRIFTRREYSTGSVRLADGFDSEHPAGDHAHMNARYGQEVMAKLVEHVRERTTLAG